jgi:two-component system, sensor histidine kinase and response regulator
MSGKSLSVHESFAESYPVAPALESHGEKTTPPIELVSLMRRCLDDNGFCAMVLHKFAVRSSDQLAALERALESANALELARQAHTLQGVAANLSALALRDRAEELEAAAARGDLQTARRALEHTRRELSRCVTAIPALLARVSPQG